ncbi:hypothetical protein BDY17DRAFT_292727 [Neohortaea acidophila]|uniref:Uncharacterized protein n=1 Tax=Neohortaea acidophila TaxID=245834 RepID=A0A6A6PZ03_9PEZI|nr:uncharacterized protein BDY17DRAFT_292727 [Neohortaea acidophila]KAF2484996.1 hypothetical protein BDY17DRAFT_292727 [Neohortaea acidophila]
MFAVCTKCMRVSNMRQQGRSVGYEQKEPICIADDQGNILNEYKEVASEWSHGSRGRSEYYKIRRKYLRACEPLHHRAKGLVSSNICSKLADCHRLEPMTGVGDAAMAIPISCEHMSRASSLFKTSEVMFDMVELGFQQT